MPKVSVIIPAYNSERYLGETLSSVLWQSYQDFEIIVVDDGSTDNTPLVVEQFKKFYSDRIRLIRKENGGPASARNVGIQTAESEFIAFLDADDLWLREKLEKQMGYFEGQSPAVGMVYTSAKKFDSFGIWTLPKSYHMTCAEGEIYPALLQVNFIPNQSVIVRRQCFDHVGLFDESPEVFSSEDYDMWLRIARQYKVSYVNEVLSLYREHPDGINKRWARAMNANVNVMKKHLAIVSGNKILEDIIRRALIQQYVAWGYFHLREGDMKASRQMLDQALGLEFDFKTWLLKLGTYVPHRVLAWCHRARTSLQKPPGIIKDSKALEKVLAGLREKNWCPE